MLETKNFLTLAVGALLQYIFLGRADVTASDVSERHIHFTELNAHNNNVNINVIPQICLSQLRKNLTLYSVMAGIPKYIQTLLIGIQRCSSSR